MKVFSRSAVKRPRERFAASSGPEIKPPIRVIASSNFALARLKLPIRNAMTPRRYSSSTRSLSGLLARSALPSINGSPVRATGRRAGGSGRVAQPASVSSKAADMAKSATTEGRRSRLGGTGRESVMRLAARWRAPQSNHQITDTRRLPAPVFSLRPNPPRQSRSYVRR